MTIKKNFYAISIGVKPGIYENWPKAHAQVKGYPNAKYKGFVTRAEAEAWLANPFHTATPPRVRPPKKISMAPADTSPKDDEVTIYTDGGARFNPGPGGYGVVLICNGQTTELSGGFKHTTNNRMELMGCIVALRNLEQRDMRITVYSDSQYVVNGINKGWAKSWRKRGWVKSNKQPAINPDLWAELLELCEDLNIVFRWVKGHAGHPQNERCDEMAVAWSGKDNLPVDLGYQG